MIESLNQNMDTISYIIAIVILLSPFILKQKFGKGHIAGLTITIGIFGTFFGVFIGLLNFNPEEITASIPKLINGLQTAFVTSIAGLLANLVLRIMPSIYGFKEEVIGKKSDDLVEQMVCFFAALSCASVFLVFRCGNAQVAHFSTVLKAAHLGVAAQVADENDFVD